MSNPEGIFRRIGESLPAGYLRVLAASMTGAGRQHLAAQMERERVVFALRAVTPERDREAVTDEAIRRGGTTEAIESVYREVIAGEFPRRLP